MDISLVLVEYCEAPPEGTRHNGGFNGKEICFFFQENTDFPENREHRKTSSSNGHPRVKLLCPLHSDWPPLSVGCFHLSLTKKPIYRSLSARLCSHNPLVRVFLPPQHDTNRALLPCAWRPMHEIKGRQTMQIKLWQGADQALRK